MNEKLHENPLNQISLTDWNESRPAAGNDAAGAFRELCDQVLQLMDTPPGYAIWQKNRTASVLKLGSQAVFSVSETRGGCRIQARAGRLPAEQAGLPFNTEDDAIRIEQLDPEQQKVALRRYFEQVMDQGSGDRFACCSLYRQCSGAAVCVQPDRLLALDCAYRLNLKQGRVYYS